MVMPRTAWGWPGCEVVGAASGALGDEFGDYFAPGGEYVFLARSFHVLLFN
jgi:hypothetical protein